MNGITLTPSDGVRVARPQCSGVGIRVVGAYVPSTGRGTTAMSLAHEELRSLVSDTNLDPCFHSLLIIPGPRVKTKRDHPFHLSFYTSSSV